MQDKWNIGKKERVSKDTYVAAVDINTKDLLALEVTDEKVYDGKVMKQLVEQVLENKNIKIKSVVLADDGEGIYESNKNFKYLQKKKILPGIS